MGTGRAASRANADGHISERPTAKYVVSGVSICRDGLRPTVPGMSLGSNSTNIQLTWRIARLMLRRGDYGVMTLNRGGKKTARENVSSSPDSLVSNV
jgi:hypothetical protein